MTTLGKYELHEALGSGAFADVYRATDTMLKRTVALKVLKPALLADNEAFNRFVQEAQVTAGLFHPHIATALDIGETEGYHYLAMRFVDGQALDKLLKRYGKLPTGTVMTIIGQIASALQFAHDKGLGVVADFPTDTVVAYTRDENTLRGKAQIYRSGKLLKTVDMETAVPHNFIINLDHDGHDTWVATGKGLAWAIGNGYYPGLEKSPGWLVINK